MSVSPNDAGEWKEDNSPESSRQPLSSKDVAPAVRQRKSIAMDVLPKEMQEYAKSFDADGSGTINPEELMSVFNSMQEKDWTIDIQRRQLYLALVTIAILLVSVFGLTLLAIEMSKDMRIEGGGLKDASTGEPVQVASTDTEILSDGTSVVRKPAQTTADGSKIPEHGGATVKTESAQHKTVVKCGFSPQKAAERRLSHRQRMMRMLSENAPEQERNLQLNQTDELPDVGFAEPSHIPGRHLSVHEGCDVSCADSVRALRQCDVSRQCKQLVCDRPDGGCYGPDGDHVRYFEITIDSFSSLPTVCQTSLEQCEQAMCGTNAGAFSWSGSFEIGAASGATQRGSSTGTCNENSARTCELRFPSKVRSLSGCEEGPSISSLVEMRDEQQQLSHNSFDDTTAPPSAARKYRCPDRMTDYWRSGQYLEDVAVCEAVLHEPKMNRQLGQGMQHQAGGALVPTRQVQKGRTSESWQMLYPRRRNLLAGREFSSLKQCLSFLAVNTDGCMQRWLELVVTEQRRVDILDVVIPEEKGDAVARRDRQRRATALSADHLTNGAVQETYNVADIENASQVLLFDHDLGLTFRCFRNEEDTAAAEFLFQPIRNVAHPKQVFHLGIKFDKRSPPHDEQHEDSQHEHEDHQEKSPPRGPLLVNSPAPGHRFCVAEEQVCSFTVDDAEGFVHSASPRRLDKCAGVNFR